MHERILRPDTAVAREKAHLVTGFGLPIYVTNKAGKREVWETVDVASYGQTPDGRWYALHGQEYALATKPGEWEAPIVDPADPLMHLFDQRTTFSSLDEVFRIAEDRQKKVQAMYDKEPPE